MKPQDKLLRIQVLAMELADHSAPDCPLPPLLKLVSWLAFASDVFIVFKITCQSPQCFKQRVDIYISFIEGYMKKAYNPRVQGGRWKDGGLQESREQLGLEAWPWR